MPAVITHALISEESAKQFPPNLLGAVRKHPDYFFLGSQGPDLFFFYRPLSRKEDNVGQFLHRSRVEDFFSCLLETLRGETDGVRYERMLAYAAGFVSHYSADTIFHPVVYALIKEDGGGLKHQQIENDWDVYFLRKYRGKEAEKLIFPFSTKKIIRDGDLFAFFSFLCEKLGRRKATNGRFASAIRLFARYLRVFHGRCYLLQRRWEKTERFFRIKPRLSRLYPRETPSPEVLDGERLLNVSGGKNADELFCDAVEQSARLAGLFSDALVTGELPRGIFDKNYLTAQKT